MSLTSQSSPIRRTFLPGSTTAGHYQIELRCDVCHTPGMGVKQNSCLECHEAELKTANDTHPIRKFNDPANAQLLEVLDARQCTTCHEEHVPDRTHPMGLSLPTDYCYRCHQDIATVRPSHVGLEFDTCASAGCHNFHDNRALYENFLASHSGESPLLESALVALRNGPGTGLVDTLHESLNRDEHDAPDELVAEDEILSEWSASAHAHGGVNCSACHQPEGQNWDDRVSLQTCQSCHVAEADGFLASRHGMRLSVGLEPMTPADARLAMKESAATRELTCNACHPAHDYSTKTAAVESCLECHDDDHSLAYRSSPHFELWQAELDGTGQPGSGVSCATCHLPRFTDGKGGSPVHVMHNQNDNLRPNEKMIRSVCANCHGLEFTIDSLADADLVARNFDRPPSAEIESVEMAYKWLHRKKSQNARSIE